MTSELAAEYQKAHAREAARVLETMTVSQIMGYLSAMPADTQADILGNLLPELGGRCLAALPIEDCREVIDDLRSTTAAALLATLKIADRQTILDALPTEKRENIRHLLRYPADTAGALMLTRTILCRDDASVRHAKRIVRRFGDTEVPIVAVVNDDMRPVGTMSVTQLIRLRERELVRQHMRSCQVRVPAYADVKSVVLMSAWSHEDFLPVVAASSNFVGLLSKAAVHAHALALRGGARDTADFTHTAIAIADLVWGPAAEVLARVTSDASGADHGGN